jgi:hypothetical protein
MKTEKYCTCLEIDGSAPRHLKLHMRSVDVATAWVSTIGTKGFLAGFEKDCILTTTDVN